MRSPRRWSGRAPARAPLSWRRRSTATRATTAAIPLFTKEYLIEGKAKDPIQKARARLLELGVSEAELDKIDQDMAAEIEAAYEFAKSAPAPDPAEVTKYMYVSDNERSVLR